MATRSTGKACGQWPLPGCLLPSVVLFNWWFPSTWGSRGSRPEWTSSKGSGRTCSSRRTMRYPPTGPARFQPAALATFSSRRADVPIGARNPKGDRWDRSRSEETRPSGPLRSRQATVLFSAKRNMSMCNRPEKRAAQDSGADTATSSPGSAPEPAPWSSGMPRGALRMTVWRRPMCSLLKLWSRRRPTFRGLSPRPDRRPGRSPVVGRADARRRRRLPAR